MKPILLLLFSASLLLSSNSSRAQKKSKANLVYVDKEGVLRWTKNNREASFFGVNYTAPFAYSYRAHKALGVDIEEAIRQDVYELARLDVDAFRVHVWDTEISDTLGNLLENDHLRLFDFLLAELEKRNIKAIITPIAFWGNGYPEKDEATPGFSRKYGKGNATTNEVAIRAQENYLRQFFKHVNPYTQLTYVSDQNVIAAELNNEPSHSGSKEKVTDYINRLASAARSVGWTKPLFYNISQSPYYAAAVAKANIDGVSFQWYPTGLVANHEQQGNLLPNVDHYPIPYDTIPEYHSKSKMVYEFDAADVLQSCIYPAVARSFREAGFQWATQFAYDPTALAYANTEYQTHYLNLFYTPSKAISVLIASKVFHRLPRLKAYGSYPQDSTFDVFRVSYKNSLSEMNSAKEFYYSNSTSSTPPAVSQLTHVAGVGTSAVVKYEGTGAYFLDRLDDGIWRLEVMPDAINIRDPFEKVSPEKEVTRIEWQKHFMEIVLPDIGQDFRIKGLNKDNEYVTAANGNGFLIEPGTFLITAARAKGKTFVPPRAGELGLNEFFAPQPGPAAPFVSHVPCPEVSANRSFIIRATIAGIDSNDKVSLLVSRLGGAFNQSAMLSMERKTFYDYAAEVPAKMATPGLLNYRVIVERSGHDYFVFPGNHKGDPFAWDYYNDETWQTLVAAENTGLEIYNPTTDRAINIYPTFRRGFQTSYTTGPDPGRLVLKLSSNNPGDDPMGFQYYIGARLNGRSSETFNTVVLRARTAGPGTMQVKITLINKDAFSFSAVATITDSFKNIEIPFSQFAPDSFLLLPRPYPGFLPLRFKAPGISSFSWPDMEKIQITASTPTRTGGSTEANDMEVESVWAKKEN